MTTLHRVLLLSCTFGLVLPSAAEAKDRDKDKKKSQASEEASSRSMGGLAPGSCEAGVAERVLDANNVTARLFNNGSLFFGNSVEAAYVNQGAATIFASGLWVGGKVDGEILTAGATYSRFEFWPGPLAEGGRPVNPSDCSEYDRMWKVSATDIARYETTGTISRDLAEWPVLLGAPVLAAELNDFDDDGDGLIDEGSNGIDDNGDGDIDDITEQERVDVQTRLNAGLSPYDLEAGDRPEIILDQSVWWVMNDVGNTHTNTSSEPLGIEVQAQAFAIGESGPLGNTTFYKYKIINKSGRNIDSTYVSIFSDPDVGVEYQDDFVGSVLEQSLGYAYNADDNDVGAGGYGRGVPAVGYDFFQGPILDEDVPGVGDEQAPDTLGLTGFNYFDNGGIPELTDPSGRIEYYNVMQGLTPPGAALTVGGQGLAPGNEPTRFAFPGDPLTGEGWSEVSAENGPGDRRFVVTTGPFTLADGAEQDIVFGIVWSRALSRNEDEPNLASVAQLRVDDIVAQSAYDNNFQILRAPPAPPTAQPIGVDPETTGNQFLSATEADGQVVLTWGYPESSPNYNGQFRENGVIFEGFNVYRYPTSAFAAPQLVATYDIDNSIDLVANLALDPTLIGSGVDPLVPELAAFGSNSGLQYFHVVQENLDNNRDYYYGVTAYGVKLDEEITKVYESLPAQITVRPSRQSGIAFGGSEAQSEIDDVTLFARDGDSFRTLEAQVVNPQAVREAVYIVDIVSAGDSLDTPTYILTRNEEGRDPVVLFDGPQVFENTDRIPSLRERQVFDGLAFFNVSSELSPLDFQNFFFDPPGELAPFADQEEFDLAGTGYPTNNEASFTAGLGIVEIASPLGPVCRGEGDFGCEFYDGNSVFNDENQSSTYIVAATTSSGIADSGTRLLSGPGAAVVGAQDIELRFTEACANDATPCYGLYYASIIGGLDESIVTRVPFEAYSVGLTENDNRENVASDDVRLIPIIRPRAEDEEDDDIFFDSWSDSFVTEDVIPDEASVQTTTGAAIGSVLTSDETYIYYPTQPDGYAQFAAAATASGGAGATYVDTYEGDPECSRSGAYADFCYRGDGNEGGSNNWLIGRMVYGAITAEGAPPPAGTVVRYNFVGKRPELAVGEKYTLNASGLAFVTGEMEIAEDALSGIGVTPNPYRGRSEYERSSNDRRVRFVGLPEQARIRVYTVAGSLIRELDKAGPGSTLDWNLETANNLPVASGMYLVHIEARDGEGNRIGEKVLKLGVIQRKTRVNVF